MGPISVPKPDYKRVSRVHRRFPRQYLKVQQMVRGPLGCASVGKVRIAAVKKVSRELVAQYPDKFSKNYEENKVALAVLDDARTKRLRNSIVGYVTRLESVRAEIAALRRQ